jgi:hypothetical protein
MLGARHSSGAVFCANRQDARHKAKVTSPEESRAPTSIFWIFCEIAGLEGSADRRLMAVLLEVVHAA